MQSINYDKGGRHVFTRNDELSYEGGWLYYHSGSRMVRGSYIVEEENPFNYRVGFRGIYFEAEEVGPGEVTLTVSLSHVDPNNGLTEIHTTIEPEFLADLGWNHHDDETPGDLWEAWGLICEGVYNQAVDHPTRVIRTKEVLHLIPRP